MPAEQLGPSACPDGTGGLFVAWSDRRGGDFYEVDVLAARYASNGSLMPGWSCRAVITLPGSQGIRAVVADGTGGLFVVVEDDLGTRHREAHVRIHHVDGSGNSFPGWAANGVLAVSLPSRQYNSEAISDGAGGVYVAWGDRRNIDGDVYVQRYLADGNIAPGWAVNGSPADTMGGQFSGLLGFFGAGGLALAPDGSLIIGISSRRPAPLHRVFVQKLTPNGEVAPDWPANGVPIPTTNTSVGAVTSDGMGGAFVAWTDMRNTPPGEEDSPYPWMEIYAHHVLSNGTLDPAWPVGGIAVCTADYRQDEPRMMADDMGGALLVWEDDRSASPGIYGMRLVPEGLDPRFPANGRKVCDVGFVAHGHIRLAPDGMNGAYISFEDATNARVHLQRIQNDGMPAPGWSVQGIPVTPTYTYQEWPAIAADDAGGAYMVWSDFYFAAGGMNVRAQRFVPDLATAVTATLVSAEGAPGEVALVWQLSEAGLGEVRLERQRSGEDWQVVATVAPDGTGRIEHRDRDVEAGESLRYRLAWGSGDAIARSAEVVVEIPHGHRFALDGVRPNPGRRDGHVRFTLDRSGVASLELIDLAGRRVGTLERRLDAGPHIAPLKDLGAPATGIYWLRLRHEDRVLTTRAVILD